MRPTPSEKHDPSGAVISSMERICSGRSLRLGFDDEKACAIRAMYLAGMNAVSEPVKSPIDRCMKSGVTCVSSASRKGDMKKQDELFKPEDDQARNFHDRPPSSNPSRNKGEKRDEMRPSSRSRRFEPSSCRTATDTKSSGRS